MCSCTERQSIGEELVLLYKPEVNNTHESSFLAFSLIFHWFWSSLIVQQGAVGLRMLSTVRGTETCAVCIIKNNCISPVFFEHIGSRGVQERSVDSSLSEL